MKQIYIEKQAKDQVHQNFRNTNSEVHCSIIRVLPNSDFLNIFLIQNKGEGPPGNVLNPDHPPDNKAGPPDIDPGSPDGDRDQKPDRIETSGDQIFKNPSKGELNFNTEIQRFNKYRNSNYLQTLNFTNMKKQILFLAFFVLVGLSSVTTALGQTTSLGQYITSTQPIIQLNCVATSEALHPFPGTSYTYTMTGDPAAAEQPDEWTWFATKDPNFISTDAAGVTTLNIGSALQITSGELMAATNYLTPSTTNSVQITWSPEVLAGTVYQGAAGEPTFVVGFATGSACADNIQVYEINPRFNFIVDIANIDATGTTLNWDDLTEQCVDVVRGASYDGTSKELTMNYGTNTLYFEVSAANFINDWTPTFQIVEGLADAQTAVISLHTTLADAQTAANAGFATHTWSATDIGAAGADWATGEALDATNPDEIVTGVSVFVRVVITNSTYESLTDNPFTLAVDAIDNAGAGQWDMEDADCDPLTATDEADQADEATHTVTPRPTITRNGTTDAGAPDPTVTIPKTPYNPADF